MTNEMTLALAAALNSKTSTGRYHEPHELRGMIDSRIQQDIRWAIRVLEVVLENDGSTTPHPVSHWVTYGKDLRSSRLPTLVAKAKTGKLTAEERAWITSKALRYSKQAAARMLLNA